MSYNYLVTAHKGTAVTATQTGSFTGQGDLNLLQAKGSSLNISQVTAEGLKPVMDVDVFGRIIAMQLFKPKNGTQELLFLMTARYHVAVLSYDADTRDVVTRAYGDVKERVGKPTQGRQTAVVDPASKLIAIHMNAGLLKVVPLELDSSSPLKAFNIRLEDLFLIDLQFLQGFDNPTIVYLAKESSACILKTASISLRDKEFLPSGMKPVTVEAMASILWPVPLPYGGVLVVGGDTLAYYNRDIQHCIDPPVVKDSIVSCVGPVDHSRYLLGDAKGRLLMLFLEFQQTMDTGGSVPELMGMRLEVLGETSSPASLCYLDNGVVFVGSTFGDSQLVKLSSSESANGGYVEVMESFTNIGPILDMSVVDFDKQGRDVVVCCSGVGKDGALRIVNSGIGINEAASIDLAGIKGIWSLHCGTGSEEFDNTVILSFVEQTTALSIAGEEVEETEIAGLASDQQTFLCANVIGSNIIQCSPPAGLRYNHSDGDHPTVSAKITSKSVRLIGEETLELLSEWFPPDGRNISTATGNLCQVVVAVGRDLYYLELNAEAGSEKIVQISYATMDHEVACVDITPLGAEKQKSEICAIGLWTDISVRLVTLPKFENLYTQPLGGDIIPRSILMAELDGVYYLMCALGDGCLYYYTLDPVSGQLDSGKKVVLGTKPIILRLFQSKGASNVFACSDHPTIIHSSNHKLLFSNVNVKEVQYMCTLNSGSFKDSLALVDSSTLVIGSVDQIQMLHIDTIQLGESPKRITYQESTQTFLVSSSRIEVPKKSETAATTPRQSSVSTTATNVTVCPKVPGVSDSYEVDEEIEVFSLLLVEPHTFEILHVYQLSERECAISVTSCSLGGGARSVYVVGTAFVNPQDSEPTKGRILVLQVSNNKLELLHAMMVGGTVYQVREFSDKLLATVNSSVVIYQWAGECELEEECSYCNNILAIYLKTKGDFILVGDLIRSLKLLVYKHEQGLEECGMDLNISPCYCTAIEMIDDENYVGADGRHIFVCQKNTEATVEAEMMYMLQPSRLYIGDNINVFQKGSLVMEHPGSSSSLLQGKPILFGTVHGTIGLIGQLTSDTYQLLSRLQQKMANCVKSVGNIEHEVYRSFANEHRSKPMAGFIDGDLVEKFLDLPHPQMEEIARDVKLTDSQGAETDVTVEDILKVVEDLSRLH